MKHYFKVDQARHRALAKQWMRHSPGYPVWIVATVLLLLFGVYVRASSYLDFCVNAINKDTVPMMTVVSVVFGLLACGPPSFPIRSGGSSRAGSCTTWPRCSCTATSRRCTFPATHARTGISLRASGQLHSLQRHPQGAGGTGHPAGDGGGGQPV